MASNKGPGRAPHVPPVKPVDAAARVGTIGGMDARQVARTMDEAFAEHEADSGSGVTPGLAEFAAGRTPPKRGESPTH